MRRRSRSSPTHDRFGLPAEDLHVFCQGTMPAVDVADRQGPAGAPDRVALSPDGHGGMLAALERSGALDDIERRGIEHLFYFQVDNPLVDICGPSSSAITCCPSRRCPRQVVAKRDPLERVGNVVRGRRPAARHRIQRPARRRRPDGATPTARWRFGRAASPST